jgi:N-acetyl-1-D-myo-inositol-2-amino-2-deoxy-alpha-D-glucopyranoside deacetylase
VNEPQAGAALRVLGIFPHPDDEAYSCGGTLARLSDEGAHVAIVCATRGERGRDRRPQPVAGEELGRVREEELRAACRVLGAAPPRFLDLHDGGVATCDFPAVVGAIVAIMRDVRPHLVLTLGPDGVYGHPDHLALYRLVIAAFGAAGGGNRFPAEQFGAPWAPLRLFCAAFPRGLFRPQYERMTVSPSSPTMRGVDPDKLGTEPGDIVAAIDIRSYAERKLRAIACHRSQLPDGDPYQLFPEGIVQRLLAFELFTLAAGIPLERRAQRLDEGLQIAAES